MTAVVDRDRTDAAAASVGPITQLWGLLVREQLPQRHSRELSALCQQDAAFQLAVHKMQRLRRLQAVFGGRAPRRLLIAGTISALDPALPGWQVRRLPKGFFDVESGATMDERCEQLRDAVVIVNNNDVGPAPTAPGYCGIYERSERTVFVAWDWDNHHWLDRSVLLAAHSDVYAPAHEENLYLLSRFNPTTVGPVFCASVQWSRQFLADRLGALLAATRSDEPLGMHIPYAAFVYRNRVVSTLGQHFPHVGFSDRAFHDRGPEDRLLEWAAHKAHWIVPVLNDVPIRIFDALVTGGIPIVPQALRHRLPARDIPAEHIVFYGPEDVVSPQAVVARANALFDAGGLDGIAARHRLALQAHHGNHRITQMLDHVAAQFAWA